MNTPARRLPSPALLAATLIATALIAGRSAAQVTRYDLSKEEFFTQSQDNAVDLPSYVFGGYAYLETVFHEDADTVTLTGPGTVTPASLSVNQFGNWNGFLGYHNTSALIEQAIPPSGYKFSISGGDLGSRSAALTLAQPSYPLTIPYVTDDAFTRFQNMNPAQEFVFSISTFTPNPAANEWSLGVTIQDVCGTSFPFNVTDPIDNIVTIPAGTLAPAHQYVIILSFSNSIAIPNAGFSGATARSDFGRATQFTFFAGYDGCLADITHDQTVDLEDFFAFFNCFDAGQPCADLNGCDGVTLDDFFVFFNAWDAQCA